MGGKTLKNAVIDATSIVYDTTVNSAYSLPVDVRVGGVLTSKGPLVVDSLSLDQQQAALMRAASAFGGSGGGSGGGGGGSSTAERRQQAQEEVCSGEQK